jgi:hypothetical protein
LGTVLDLYRLKSDHSLVKTENEFYLDAGSLKGEEWQSWKNNIELVESFDDQLKFLSQFKLLPIMKGGKLPLYSWPWKMGKRKDYYREPSSIFIRLHLRHRGNVAVLAGRSNLLIVDVDRKQRNYRDNFWNQFYKKTLAVETPAKGYHLYFRKDIDLNKLSPEEKLDIEAIFADADVIRSTNGYVVSPPSELRKDIIDQMNFKMQEKRNQKLNWKAGVYRWVYPKAEILPFSKVLVTAHRQIK